MSRFNYFSYLAPLVPALFVFIGHMALDRLTDIDTMYHEIATTDVLTEGHMRIVLTVAGWPNELHEEALFVAWCENGRWTDPDGSRLFPTYVRGDGGSAVGLWQVHVEPWQPYFVGYTHPSYMLDPFNAAEIAYRVYLYDIERGKQPWWQWIHDGSQNEKQAHCGPY